MSAAATIDARGLRARMIDQLKKGLTLSEAVERALRALPREAFLPGTDLDRVYSGSVVPTKWDASGTPISSSSEVGVMAVMADQLALAEGQRVLEIGSGTGYNAAMLASIVGGRGRVTTVEIDSDLAESAREHLACTGFARVDVRVADGWLGWPDGAPYDRIELTASTMDVSPHWVEQLADDGRLVVPLRTLAGSQMLAAFRKSGTTLRSTSLRPGGFMPLRGTNVDPESAVTAGDYEFELASPSAEAVRTVTALLAVGLIDPDAPGLAVVEMAGAVVAGPLSVITTFGVPSVADRLRDRLANLNREGLGGLSIVAARSNGVTPEGEIVVRRKNYSFVFSRGIAGS